MKLAIILFIPAIIAIVSTGGVMIIIYDRIQQAIIRCTNKKKQRNSAILKLNPITRCINHKCKAFNPPHAKYCHRCGTQTDSII